MTDVKVDVGKCVGAGQCVMAAPEVFDQRDDDGMVVLLHDEVPSGMEAEVREAAKLCPAMAIELAEK